MPNENVTEGNIFQFSGTFYKNNALVIVAMSGHFLHHVYMGK